MKTIENRNCEKMDFTVRIAKTNILIHSVYSGIYNTCRNYLCGTTVKPDIEIRTDDGMIREEQERAKQSGEAAYSVKAAERLLVQRKIAEALLDRDTLLMHGAVIAAGNDSYMFTGRSGTGKTTHIQKWLENVRGSFVVNGDKPFVIINGEGAFACGTPWCGKESMGTNIVVPLRSIIFMDRSTRNQMEPASFRTVLPRLLEQTYMPPDADQMKKTLELLLKLKNYVSFYRFRFDNYQEDAFRTSFDTLTNRETS